MVLTAQAAGADVSVHDVTRGDPGGQLAKFPARTASHTQKDTASDKSPWGQHVHHIVKDWQPDACHNVVCFNGTSLSIDSIRCFQNR